MALPGKKVQKINTTPVVRFISLSSQLFQVFSL